VSAIIIKRVMTLALAFGFITFPYSVHALVQGGKVQSNSIYAGLSDGDLLLALNIATAGEDTNYCEELAPLLREMVERDTFTDRVKLASAIAEMWCAKEQKRWQDAYRFLLMAESEGADDFGSLGFSLALYAEKNNDALERLLSFAKSNDSEAILDVYIEDVLFLKNELKSNGLTNEYESMLNGLFDSPYFSQFSPRLQNPIAYALVEIDADKGRFEHMDEKLAYLKDPMTYISFLADRKFAPIWPQLEESAGPNMASVADSYVEESANRHDKEPSDDYAIQEYAHALLYAGKFEEVVALVDIKDIANMTEQQGWALNVKAYALDALGRTPESSAIFSTIASIPYEPGENDWLVSFVINRASRLSELGQFENALKANQLAESIPGSEYAKMLTLKVKICSLAGLNRVSEARPFLDQIYAKRKNSHATAAEAMLCVNDSEKAAMIVLEALANPDYSGTMAEQLQKPEFNLFSTRSVLPGLYDEFQGHSDVKAALYKVGRFIPDEYIPVAGVRRIKSIK